MSYHEVTIDLGSLTRLGAREEMLFSTTHVLQRGQETVDLPRLLDTLADAEFEALIEALRKYRRP